LNNRLDAAVFAPNMRWLAHEAGKEALKKSIPVFVYIKSEGKCVFRKKAFRSLSIRGERKCVEKKNSGLCLSKANRNVYAASFVGTAGINQTTRQMAATPHVPPKHSHRASCSTRVASNSA
jgi:hypothetical protein